jgi:hypothetical protein
MFTRFFRSRMLLALMTGTRKREDNRPGLSSVRWFGWWPICKSAIGGGLETAAHRLSQEY